MRLIIVILLLIFSKCSFAVPTENELLFQRIFTAWTNAFNHKELSASCDLFAKEVIADYRGVPQKNYAAICDGFKKIFSDKDRQYQYRFKLHRIYRWGDLATTRITWYLSIFEKGKLVSSMQDEGIDVFVKNKLGEWEIVNYIGYGVS